MILMNVTKSHAIDVFYSISRTSKKFQSVIEGKKDEILPMFHKENVFQNLPRRANKIKVCVKKLSKFFDSCSGVIECVSKVIGKQLWRSAWLLIAKRKRNWFIIERAFWKKTQNIQSVNLLQQSDIIDEVTEEPWLGNEMYILKKEDQHLFLFQSVIEGKKDEILPMFHKENVFQNLPRRANKIKVCVKKSSKFFDSCSGVIECVSKVIGKKLF